MDSKCRCGCTDTCRLEDLRKTRQVSLDDLRRKLPGCEPETCTCAGKEPKEPSAG